MKNQLTKAMAEAFDAHEEHRRSLADSRKAHKAARDADERVRVLRRLERERSRSRAATGRAA